MRKIVHRSRRGGRGSRSRQLTFEFRPHGGARRGAGRKPNGMRAGVSHLARPTLSRHHPVHVTLRVRDGLPSLRGSSMFRAVRAAFVRGRDRFGFRLVHFSVQHDHIHLLAEAVDRRALARGLQGLTIRVAKAVNRRLGRNGKVLSDRYHARALRTPRETRWALRYVLTNARKHRGIAALPYGFVDRCSSAPWFDGWNRPRELIFVGHRAAIELSDVPVVKPRTWLLRVAWRRGGPLDVDEGPVPRG